jgi:tetratricopeptide (TPR) repeat protein
MLIQNAMKIFIQFMFLVIAVCQNSLGYSQTDLDYQEIKLANKFYTEEKYNDAAVLYEKILAKGFVAPELNYNLGNAYYRMGDYKRAILNYERALLINPNDESTKTNLEFAQRYIQDKIEVVPTFVLLRWVQGFSNLFSANGWSYLSIICFISFLGMVVIFLFSRITFLRKLSIYFGFLFTLFTIISFYCAYKQDHKINSHTSAIVFSPSVTVKSSPNENGTDLFIIHEGLKVTVVGKSVGWKEIKLSDGKVGWLPDIAIEEI